MTIELLKQRLALMEKEIIAQEAIVAQQNANLNMLQGGKQELLYWIETLKSQAQ